MSQNENATQVLPRTRRKSKERPARVKVTYKKLGDLFSGHGKESPLSAQDLSKDEADAILALRCVAREIEEPAPQVFTST